MKYDRQIKQQIKLLQFKITDWINLTNYATDAYSDRVLEEIFNLTKKIEKIYKHNNLIEK